MTKTILLGFILTLISCIPKVQEPPILKPRPYDIKNDELIQFTDSFKDKLQESGTFYQHSSKFNVLFVEFGTVEWANANSRRIGECERFWSGSRSNIVRRIIRINPVFWANNQNNFAAKEELMYHELGHCILDRDHNETELPNGIAASIMNPYHIGQSYYRTYYVDYMAELFGVNSYSFKDFIAQTNLFNGGVVYASEYSPEMLNVEIEMASSHETNEDEETVITTCEH